jgi:hypothetical protein
MYATNEYFQVSADPRQRLPERLELLMYNNFLGVLTQEAWEELHKEVSGLYKWGSDMVGYMCAKCMRRPLINMYAFGPSCPDALAVGGCGNMPRGYMERWFRDARGLSAGMLDRARTIVDTASDMSAEALDRAGAVVDRARQVPGTIIKTVRKTIDDIVG